VRLVSNQPAEYELRAASAVAREELTNVGTAEVRTADLLKRLPPQHTGTLKRLYETSGLRSVEFTDFLRAFDLSGCGEEGRMIHRHPESSLSKTGRTSNSAHNMRIE
jgi:hypothetical protein